MKNRSTDILSNLSAAIIYRSIPQRTAAESTARRAIARPQATAPQPPFPQTSIPHHPRIPNKHIAGPRAPPAMNNLHSYLPANSSASPKEQTSPHSICSPLTNSLKTANILKWALWSWRQGSFSTGREEVAAEEVKMGKKEGREGKELRSEEMEVELLFLAGREERVGWSWGFGSVSFWCGVIREFDMYMNLWERNQ